jgi:hypothetical protein
VYIISMAANMVTAELEVVVRLAGRPIHLLHILPVIHSQDERLHSYEGSLAAVSSL